MSGESAALIPKDVEGGDWGDQIVDRRQLKDFSRNILHCARITRIVIVLGVVLTLVALLTSFFSGALEVDTRTIKHVAMPMRRLVICPSWGQRGMNVTVKSLTVGNLFTSKFPDWREERFTSHKCPPFKYYKWGKTGGAPRLINMQELDEVNNMGCQCIDSDFMLGLQDVGKEFARFALTASFTDDRTKALSIAINSGGDDYPGDWNYLGLGVRTVADLTRETSFYGKTAFTQGQAVETYMLGVKNAMSLDPSQMIEGADTELVFAYGSYFENIILDISSLFSPYALFSLAAILLATLNAVQLFNVIFPEKLDESDPQQIEPSPFLQAALSRFSSCCQRLDKDS